MEDSNQKTPESEGVSPVRYVAKRLDNLGYVVDEDIVRRLGAIVDNAISGVSGDAPVQSTITLRVRTGEQVVFDSIDTALRHVKSEHLRIRSMTIENLIDHTAGMTVEMLPGGEMRIATFGSAPDLEFVVDRLMRELRVSEQHYSWWVRNLLFRTTFRSLLLSGILLLSLVIFGSGAYLLYAREVGVNIHPAVLAEIPRGNDYFPLVVSALDSASLNSKLDILLMGQLRGFVNVDVIIARHRTIVIAAVGALAIASISLLIQLRMRSLYPLAYFALDTRAKEELEKLRQRREVWASAILIAFIVNVLAGLAVAFFA